MDDLDPEIHLESMSHASEFAEKSGGILANVRVPDPLLLERSGYSKKYSSGQMEIYKHMAIGEFLFSTATESLQRSAVKLQQPPRRR